jgi:hypothetical protein
MEPGLAKHAWKRIATGVDPLADDVLLELIGDMVCDTPCSNAPNENRFARHTNYQGTNRGRPCTASAAIARHILSEASAWHVRAIEKYSCASLDIECCGHCGDP